MNNLIKCPFCGGADFPHSFIVTRKDKFTKQNESNATPAQYYECNSCKMMLLNDSSDYEEVYSDGSYYTMDGEGDAYNFLRNRFKTIINLPKEKSDNIKRVSRIQTFIARNNEQQLNILDIGAGTGVFMYEFNKQFGNIGTVLEPDPFANEHLMELFKKSEIEVLGGMIQDVKFKSKFQLITLNRVLEHIFDPHTFLSNVKDLLTEKGIIYIEVPDIKSYFEDGPNNEAFGYGHYHVYSPKGMFELIENSGFELLFLDRCVEPSGKFTLYVFIQNKN